LVLSILGHFGKLKEIVDLIFFLDDQTSDVKGHLMSFKISERN
jgi:hypothetical protein